MDRLRWGLWALSPAPFIFAARALIWAGGKDPGTITGLDAATAVGGVLSLLGVALLLWRRLEALPAALLVVTGHFGVSPVLPELGAGMVYLGTGLLVAPWRPWGLAAGALAMLAAPLRPLAAGHFGVALGAAALGVALVAAASDMRHRN